MEFNTKVFWVQMHNLPIACMNETIGREIGSTIGKVQDFDVQVDRTEWGKTLWVLIELDLYKPITKGQILNVDGSKPWVPLTYENLLRICFIWGKITHRSSRCEKEQTKFNDTIDQFGWWLRTNKGRKQQRGKQFGGPTSNDSLNKARQNMEAPSWTVGREEALG